MHIRHPKKEKKKHTYLNHLRQSNQNTLIHISNQTQLKKQKHTYRSHLCQSNQNALIHISNQTQPNQ